MIENTSIIKKLFLHSFTGKDNATFDIGRILWAISVLSYILIDCYSVYKGQDFSEINFGMGLSGLLASGGFGVAIKSKSEPNGEGQNDKQ